MSGGRWNYIQGRLDYEVADEIAEEINKGNYEDDEGVISRLKQAEKIVRCAAIAIERVDYLVSGDDGPESFVRRWDEEMRESNIEFFIRPIPHGQPGHVCDNDPNEPEPMI